jgi:hypothetical protein
MILVALPVLLHVSKVGIEVALIIVVNQEKTVGSLVVWLLLVLGFLK